MDLCLQGIKIMQIFVYLRSCPDDNQYAHPLDIMPFVDVLSNKVIITAAATRSVLRHSTPRLLGGRA